MSWNRIIGQQRVKRVIGAALERHQLAHAYLFSGPEGAGMDAMAMELAIAANCERADGESCGTCQSCRLASTLQHPNINLVFALPVGKGEKLGDGPLDKLADGDVDLVREQLALKSVNPYHPISLPRANTIKINSIRSIRQEASLTAYRGGFKVFVILGAEQMGPEAANALLKTLEEPHPDTLIILTSSRPDALLPTVISRCQHIVFDPLTDEEIAAALVQQENVPQNIAALASKLAGGSYTRALSLMDTDLSARRDAAIDFLRTVFFKPRQELLNEIDRVTSEYDRAAIVEYLSFVQVWLRDALMIVEGHERIVNADARESLAKFASHFRNFSYLRAIELTDRAISLLSKNVYIPLILLDLALQLQAAEDPSPASNASPARLIR
jgi:DNA polymerase-3 subunit delta'